MPALTLDATPKGAQANSYVTLAEAETYFAGRVNASAWTAATVPVKEQALVAATARLEQESFLGGKTTTEQRLKWPRALVRDPDTQFGGYEFQQFFDSDTVPRPIREAACELALTLLASGLTDYLADTSIPEFTNIKVGPIEVTPSGITSGGRLPTQVVRLLASVLIASGAAVKLVRGG